jgi:hypothetical protein
METCLKRKIISGSQDSVYKQVPCTAKPALVAVETVQGDINLSTREHVRPLNCKNNELLILLPRWYLGTGEQSPGFVLWILLLWAPFPVVFLLCGPSSRDRP